MSQTQHVNKPIQFPKPWLRCDGLQLQQLLQAALFSLEANYQHVNQLNVYPIPDGDTGINMLHTMRQGVAEMANGRSSHLSQAAAQFAQGTRHGARGNSGVILSEIFQGIAEGLAGKETATAVDFAAGLETAVQYAYAAVSDPTEGTILTVIRETAVIAQAAAKEDGDLRPFFNQLLSQSQQSLAQTPDLLPILKQSGVVDSGGQGLVYLFQGIAHLLNGQLHETQIAYSLKNQTPAQAFAVPSSGALENPYDVQFLLYGNELNVKKIKATIDAMGDSAVVAGDSSTVKVHVHVKNPGEPLAYGSSLGQITDVVVENMQLQMEAIVNQPPMPPPPVRPDDISSDQIGVVAIVAGAGFESIFNSIRGAFTLRGGQTQNPSVDDILNKINAVPSDRVIVLPNNKNIILTAEAAAKISKKTVTVVPTRSAPQGLAAMLMLNLEGELGATAVAMQTAANEIITAEITNASRSVTLDGIDVKAGELIGLLDGRLAASGVESTAVIFSLLTQIDMEAQELIAIYRGLNIPESNAQALQDSLQQKFPDHTVELHDGQQSHAAYILGIE